MKHVFLLEPKLADAQQFIKKIESNAKYRVTHALNIREAWAKLMENTFQVALVPVTRNDSIVYSIRALQAGLPIILIADSEDRVVSERQAAVAWGIIGKNILLDSFSRLELLDQSSRHIEELFWPKDSQKDHETDLDMERLTKLVQNALINPDLQFVLLTKGAQIIGFHNQIPEDQLIEVAAQVNESWDTRPRTAQIQYFENSKFSTAEQPTDSLLLFTRPFQDYLLTLGAIPNSSIIELRQASDLIVNSMQQAPIHNQKQVIPKPLATQKKPSIPRTSYALLWPIRSPLSAAQTTRLEHIFRSIANENDCHLTHIEIKDKCVHLVGTCPPYQTGSWMAGLFKQESNRLFQITESHTDQLWHDNHYVKSSQSPLSNTKIEIFLQLTAVPA